MGNKEILAVLGRVPFLDNFNTFILKLSLFRPAGVVIKSLQEMAFTCDCRLRFAVDFKTCGLKLITVVWLQRCTDSGYVCTSNHVFVFSNNEMNWRRAVHPSALLQSTVSCLRFGLCCVIVST